MLSKNYWKEKINQRNQITSKYFRKTVKETPILQFFKMLWYKKLDERWSRWWTSIKLIVIIDMLTEAQFYPDLSNTGFSQVLHLLNFTIGPFNLPEKGVIIFLGFFEFQFFKLIYFLKRFFRLTKFNNYCYI